MQSFKSYLYLLICCQLPVEYTTPFRSWIVISIKLAQILSHKWSEYWYRLIYSWLTDSCAKQSWRSNCHEILKGVTFSNPKNLSEDVFLPLNYRVWRLFIYIGEKEISYKLLWKLFGPMGIIKLENNLTNYYWIKTGYCFLSVRGMLYETSGNPSTK